MAKKLLWIEPPILWTALLDLLSSSCLLLGQRSGGRARWQLDGPVALILRPALSNHWLSPAWQCLQSMMTISQSGLESYWDSYLWWGYQKYWRTLWCSIESRSVRRGSLCRCSNNVGRSSSSFADSSPHTSVCCSDPSGCLIWTWSRRVQPVAFCQSVAGRAGRWETWQSPERVHPS